MAQVSTRDQVRRVLVVTLILNFTVAIGKILVGAISGVLAISADGIHSTIDGASNVVALLANRIADKPPDEEHPYGHRRFETMAALLIGALLLLTAWEIVGGAVERLQSGASPEITPLTLAVVIGTLVVNLFVSVYERREGKRLNSELLLADAANTGADVFVTLSVLASTVIVALTGWTWIDPLAALVIVALIGRAAWQVLHQTGSVLVDTAPIPAGQLTVIVEAMPVVHEVVQARSRGPADAIHIDLDVRIAPETTAERSAAIAREISERLQSSLEGVSEVFVRFMPEQQGKRDYALAARASADALGLATHEVRVCEGPNGKLLEMHVEVPPGQTLGAAHAQVSQLEARVQQALPDVTEVVTHIEPAFSATPAETAIQRSAAAQVERDAKRLLEAHDPDAYWHDIRATRYEDGYALTMHVTLPANTTVEEAHDRAEAAELLLRRKIAGVNRATIHTEPPDESA